MKIVIPTRGRADVIGKKALRLFPDATLCVGADEVEALLGDAESVRQEEQLGTGHAVMCARETLRGVFLDELLLGGAEPALHHGLGGFVLEVFAAEGAVADLLGQVAAVLVADGGQREFGTPLAK